MSGGPPRGSVRDSTRDLHRQRNSRQADRSADVSVGGPRRELTDLRTASHAQPLRRAVS